MNLFDLQRTTVQVGLPLLLLPLSLYTSLPLPSDDTKREMEAITHASSTCCCYGVSTAAAVPKAFLTASIVFQPSMLFKRTFTFSSSRLLQTSLCPVSSSPTPFLIRNSSTTSGPPLPRPRLQSSPRQSSNLLRTSGGRSGSSNIGNKKISRPQQQKPVVVVKRRSEECVPSLEEASISVRTLYQNGDPLGRRELGKCVVRWISQGMHSMASDFASAEVQGEFSELRQRVGLPTIGGTPADGGAGAAAVGGLAFVIQAQPYLYAVPMPKGLEALCFKACTHYPTLFDHFQRELRNVLQDLQCQAIFSDWRATESWKLLKDIANSAAHGERGSEQDQRKVGYSPRAEEAPTGKKSHKERLTMAETRLDVLEASFEELYQGQQRLIGVESSQEEAKSQIKRIESLVE
ncbi:hypothetical protein B296_00021234 [Ensete ventricosum]|uniref:Uncharacterized protein n=1 Tax=Ensete ventricosum TaxID=4639 RepID=A0A426ZEG3_ENSVE|nr:hypothetical protein B296_00021234 [Ensete ventricosum]